MITVFQVNFIGLASIFNLPLNTNFSRFPQFYKDYVQPKLQNLGETFESNWNGSNWIGSLDREQEMKLDEYIKENVPEHDLYYFFDIRDTFQQYSEIIDMLKPEIDFMTADLDDDATLAKIIDALDNGDVILVDHNEEDYRHELKMMQETLREEE